MCQVVAPAQPTADAVFASVSPAWRSGSGAVLRAELIEQIRSGRSPGHPQARLPGAQTEMDFCEFLSLMAGTLLKLWLLRCVHRERSG